MRVSQIKNFSLNNNHSEMAHEKIYFYIRFEHQKDFHKL